MLLDFDQILSAALSLPPADRAMLAKHLLDSVTGEDQRRIDALWADEIEKRIGEVDEGKVTPVPGDQVMDRLRSRRSGGPIVKKQEVEEMEKQHAAGYARIPSQASEFEEWESEQVWSDDEEGDSEEAIQLTAAIGGRTKVMKESLKEVEEIRHQLEGRHHSDSTQLVREDRER